MKRRMAALGLMAVTVLAAGAWAETHYEAEPVLKAADLVGSEILRGPRYTVDSRVPVKGFLYRSRFGPTSARSTRTASTCSRSGCGRFTPSASLRT